MDIENQQGGLVAKQKRNKPNSTKKDLQEGVAHLGNGLRIAFEEIKTNKQHLIGLENLIMLLSEFLEKREDFEEFITDFYEKEKARIEKEKAKADKELSKLEKEAK